MENAKSLFVGGIVGIVAIAAFAFMGDPVVNVLPSSDNSGNNTNVGAASPDMPSQYVSWGGVRNWASKCTLQGDAASTTICVMQAPTG